MAETCGFVAGLVLLKEKDPTPFDAVKFPGYVKVGMVCRKHMFDNGMIMRAVGDRMIIAPPLIMTMAEIDRTISLIRFCLVETLAELKALGAL